MATLPKKRNRLTPSLSDEETDEPTYKKHKENEEIKMDLDRAYGLCIGAAIGDSLGAFCEFEEKKICKEILDEAMRMPGGGTWGEKVKSGQVTDDTELAISLGYALCQMIEIGNGFDQQIIAMEYAEWLKSDPFDIGLCTSRILAFAPNVEKMKKEAVAYNFDLAEKFQSEGNLANGSLMRCMPLILYGKNLGNDKLYLLMKMDAELTHSNEINYLVNTAYAILALYLLNCDFNEADKNINAYNEMTRWLQKVSKKQKYAKIILNDWLQFVHGDDLEKLWPATKYKGLVKIAFQRTCFHLLQNNSFYDAMQSVIKEGGDTDTNACIVGGVIGVLHGLKKIDKEFVLKIQNCTPTEVTRDKYQAKWYYRSKIVKILFNNAPTDKMFK